LIIASKNCDLLRKILPQPEFELGTFCLSGTSVLLIRPPRHVIVFFAITLYIVVYIEKDVFFSTQRI